MGFSCCREWTSISWSGHGQSSCGKIGAFRIGQRRSVPGLESVDLNAQRRRGKGSSQWALSGNFPRPLSSPSPFQLQC